MDNEFLVVNEAAAFLKISPGTLYNLVAAKEVPFYRLLGRRFIRFKRKELAGLLKPAQSKSKKVKKGSPR